MKRRKTQGRKKVKGPSLPFSLVRELQGSEDREGLEEEEREEENGEEEQQPKRWDRRDSRKERRKRKRLEKKERNQEFHQRKRKQQSEHNLESEEIDAPDQELPAKKIEKKRKREESSDRPDEKNAKKPKVIEKKKKKSTLEALERNEQMKKNLREQEEDEEDQYLKKKLGLDKKGGRAKLRKEFEEEGLGDLWDLVDSENENPELSNSEDDIDNSLPQAREKKSKDRVSRDASKNEEQDPEEEDEDPDEEDEDPEEEDEDPDEEEMNEEEKNEEESSQEEDEDEIQNKWDGTYYSTNDLYGKKLQMQEEKQIEQARRDRERLQPSKKPSLTSSTPTISSKYVPPALRKQLQQKSSENTLTTTTQPSDPRLTRQLRGLINRISDSNLDSISTQIELLYSSYPRKETTMVLSRLIIQDCCDSGAVKNTFARIYAALVSGLHRRIGVDVGGEFVEMVARELDSRISRNKVDVQSDTQEAKESSNLVLLLSHLYHFHVVGSDVMYDFVKELIGSAESNNEKEPSALSEVDVELVMVVMRTCGLQLRKEDPGGLADVILRIKERVRQLGPANQKTEVLRKEATTKIVSVEEELSALPPRMKFMIEKIYDLKNNRVKKGGEEEVTMVNVKQMKSILQTHGMLPRKGTDRITGVSWQELTSPASEKRSGRWWKIGPQSQRLSSGGEAKKADDVSPTANQEKWDAGILELARKQRMTTDVRRGVFCVIMTSGDYVEAFERLMKLGLKNKQEREMVYVLVHCCLQEKNFNAYYAELGVRLCAYDRNFKVTFQYTFWDRMKELNRLSVRAIGNLTKLMSVLILQSALSLAVLKAADLVGQKTEKERVFFRALFKEIMVVGGKQSEEVVVQVFQRVAKGSTELTLFREQLVVYMTGLRGVNRSKVQKLRKQREEREELGEEEAEEWRNKINELIRWNKLIKAMGRLINQSNEIPV